MTQPNETLAELYLRECGGDPRSYFTALGSGQRIGQAFFNALSKKDQDLIRGTMRDPVNVPDHKGNEYVEKAIEWLLDYPSQYVSETN